MARFTIADLPEHYQRQASTQLGPQKPIQKALSPSVVQVAPEPPKAREQPKMGSRGRQRVARTRNGGTWTEARFFSHVRSALRMAFRWWKPGLDALKAAKVGKGYLCASCGKVFPRKEVEIDHLIPVGALTQLEHLPAFLARLTPEGKEAYAVLCKACHQAKTANDVIRCGKSNQSQKVRVSSLLEGQ